MKLRLPNKKLFGERLKMNKWPVNWFDDKKKLKEDKEKERRDRVDRLYPKKIKK